MQGVVYVNGTITPADHAVVPVFDHGFLYGEGVYETLRTYGRVPFAFDAHMARLRRSADLIALDVPMTDEAMLAAVNATIAAGDSPADAELYIRILLTRGVGELTYDLSATPRPTLVIIVRTLKAFPETNYTRGIRVVISGVRRNHPTALNPMVKSNNLMNTALAMQDGYRRGADEVVLLNHDGFVTECSQSNIFIVAGGVVCTPPLDAGLLPGITRALVLQCAREAGIAVEERALTADDVLNADEVFITGTTREITPVTTVDDRAIGGGLPGVVTKQLHARFKALAR